MGVVKRGEIWWVDFAEPRGSAPAFRRPAVVVSSDRFNRSRLRTVIVAAITSNVGLVDAPGNVALEPAETGLGRRSVINVTQLACLDRSVLADRVGALPAERARALDAGLRLVLRL